MSSIGKVTASLVSGTNENISSLGNFNVDFSLIKVEAPKEYHGLKAALSHRRVEDAEQGSLHRTARKLGALFEQIVPPIKTLIEVYGQRVSEYDSLGLFSNATLTNTIDMIQQEELSWSLIAGNEAAGLFSVQIAHSKSFLRYSEVVGYLRSGSAHHASVMHYIKGGKSMSESRRNLSTIDTFFDRDSDRNRDQDREKDTMKKSLEKLRQATMIYEKLTNATVSIAVLQQPLYEAKWTHKTGSDSKD